MTDSTAKRPIYVVTLHRPGDLIGGIQKHYTIFAAEASRHGISVKIITPFHTSKVLWFSLFGFGKVLAYLSKPLHAWWYEYTRLVLLKRVLRSQLSQLIPATLYAQDPVSAEAALFLKTKGYPVEVVGAVHFNLSTADEWAGKGYLTRGRTLYRRMLARDARVLPKLDRLVYVSQFMKHQVGQRLPQLEQVASWVVPNFVPTPSLAPSTQLQAELVSIGTLEPRKNQTFLLRVLYQVHQLGYHYRLALIGDGPSRTELQELTKKLKLEPYVTFLGALPNAVERLGAYRAYVHAAFIESFGIVLAEALAAGKPVFAAPVGGIPEVFDDGTEGYYWQLDDPTAAAESLIKVLENDAHYQSLSNAARRRHAQRFSSEAVGGKLLSVVLGQAPLDNQEQEF